MPIVEPSRLFKICIDNIAKNLDPFWSKDYVENWMKDEDKFLYILGPMDLLREFSFCFVIIIEHSYLVFIFLLSIVNSGLKPCTPHLSYYYTINR